MGRVIIAIVVVLLLVGGAFAFFTLNARAYTVVAELPVGAEAGSVGVQAGANDVAPVCPLGIDVAAADQVALFDLANSKIMQVSLTEGNVSSEAPFLIEPGYIVEGAIVEDGRNYIWSQDTTGETGNIDLLAANSDGVLEVAVEGGFLPGEEVSGEGERRFEDLGFLQPSEDGFLPQLNRTPERVILREWSDSLERSDGAYTVDYNLGDDGVLQYVIKRDGTEQQWSGSVAIKGDLVSARAYRPLVNNGLPLIVTESQTENGALQFSQSVLMVNLQNGEVHTYIVPISAGAVCQPKQNLAIGEDGRVYSMGVSSDTVRILQLSPQTFFTRAQVLLNGALEDLRPEQQSTAPATVVEAAAPERETPAETAPTTTTPAPATAPASQAQATPAPRFVEVRSGEKISRRQVLTNACMFLNHQWTLAQANVTYTPANGGCWRLPRSLDGRLNEQIAGLPYSWGGADRLAEFDRKLAMGRPAGHVCTPSRGGGVIADPDRAVNSVLTAGVDCSGFILRSWGWRGPRHTTSDLVTTGEIIALEDLRPGDVLNSPGSHVRMFLAWQGRSHIVIMESSVHCGGVCRRVLPLEGEFEGYVPIRPRHLTDEGGQLTAQEIATACDFMRRAASQSDAP